MASTTVAVYGILIEPREDEIEALENRSHATILIARKLGLQYYWGNFGGQDEFYLLFVGVLLAKLGVEDASEFKLDPEQLLKLDAEISVKLSAAGFTDTPKLYLRFQPDT